MYMRLENPAEDWKPFADSALSLGRTLLSLKLLTWRFGLPRQPEPGLLKHNLAGRRPPGASVATFRRGRAWLKVRRGPFDGDLTGI